jgi:hypothetical protein
MSLVQRPWLPLGRDQNWTREGGRIGLGFIYSPRSPRLLNPFGAFVLGDFYGCAVQVGPEGEGNELVLKGEECWVIRERTARE